MRRVGAAGRKRLDASRFAHPATSAGADAGTSITAVFPTTLLQLNTEDKFRGRVFSVEFGYVNERRDTHQQRRLAVQARGDYGRGDADSGGGLAVCAAAVASGIDIPPYLDILNV